MINDPYSRRHFEEQCFFLGWADGRNPAPVEDGIPLLTGFYTSLVVCRISFINRG